jgi:hypothetical protein
VADERTTPTPKAKEGAQDTMHSKPETPDRASGEGDQRGVAERDRMADAPSAGGSAGSERPGKEVIPTEDAGTLVTDIPDMDEEQAEAQSNEPVNPGQEAPDVVGRQPHETREQAKERIQKQTKEADAANKKSADRSKAAAGSKEK